MGRRNRLYGTALEHESGLARGHHQPLHGLIGLPGSPTVTAAPPGRALGHRKTPGSLILGRLTPGSNGVLWGLS